MLYPILILCSVGVIMCAVRYKYWLTHTKKCQMCGKRVLHLDKHKVTQHKGRYTRSVNMMLCQRCHLNEHQGRL